MRPYVADTRDWTKEPPAMLDPMMVLKARRWLFTDDGWNELRDRRENNRDKGEK